MTGAVGRSNARWAAASESYQTGAMMDGQYVIGWGTLALINAGLAQGKGRSGLVWFFVSLVLGPIATFIVVVLHRVGPELQVE